MAASNAQGMARRPDARARHDPLVDCSLQVHGRATLGANISKSREARLERPLGVSRRADRGIDGTQRHRLDDGVLCAFAGDVRVRIDEAWHYRGTAEIDYLRALRRD